MVLAGREARVRPRVRPEWTLGGHPHVLGRRVVRCGRAGAPWGPNPKTDDAFRAVITSLWLVLVL